MARIGEQLLTWTPREPEESDYEYDQRALKIEQRAELKWNALGLAIGLGFFALWHFKVLPGLAFWGAVGILFWLVYDDNPVRHRKALCIGRGMLFPIVALAWLVVTIWGTTNF